MGTDDIAELRGILEPAEGETLVDAARRLRQADAFDALTRAIYRLRRTRCPTMKFGFTTAELVAAVRKELEELDGATDLGARRGEGGDVMAASINLGISLTDHYPTPNGTYLSDLMYGAAWKINGRLDVIDAGGTWEGAKAAERAGVAHRDVKPENPARPEPAYMSPEQDRSQPPPWAAKFREYLDDWRSYDGPAFDDAIAGMWRIHDSLVAAARAEARALRSAVGVPDDLAHDLAVGYLAALVHDLRRLAGEDVDPQRALSAIRRRLDRAHQGAKPEPWPDDGKKPRRLRMLDGSTLCAECLSHLVGDDGSEPMDIAVMKRWAAAVGFDDPHPSVRALEQHTAKRIVTATSGPVETRPGGGWVWLEDGEVRMGLPADEKHGAAYSVLVTAYLLPFVRQVLGAALSVPQGAGPDPLDGWPIHDHPVGRFKAWLERLARHAGDDTSRTAISHLREVVRTLATPSTPQGARPDGYWERLERAARHAVERWYSDLQESVSSAMHALRDVVHYGEAATSGPQKDEEEPECDDCGQPLAHGTVVRMDENQRWHPFACTGAKLVEARDIDPLTAPLDQVEDLLRAEGFDPDRIKRKGAAIGRVLRETASALQGPETPDDRERAIVRRLAGEWGEIEVGPTESIDDVVSHIHGAGTVIMRLVTEVADHQAWALGLLGKKLSDWRGDKAMREAVEKFLADLAARVEDAPFAALARIVDNNDGSGEAVGGVDVQLLYEPDSKTYEVRIEAGETSAGAEAPSLALAVLAAARCDEGQHVMIDASGYPVCNECEGLGCEDCDGGRPKRRPHGFEDGKPITTPTADRLEHWRKWADLYDPFPEQPPAHDNERRFRVNWWIEMLEGKRPREGRLALAPDVAVGDRAPSDQRILSRLVVAASTAMGGHIPIARDMVLAFLRGDGGDWPKRAIAKLLQAMIDAGVIVDGQASERLALTPLGERVRDVAVERFTVPNRKALVEALTCPKCSSTDALIGHQDGSALCLGCGHEWQSEGPDHA
jgi:hypothetical protein